jgi:hypothetical protein
MRGRAAHPGDGVPGAVTAARPPPTVVLASVYFLAWDVRRHPGSKGRTYAFSVGNIGKEVRRIEVLPVPEPTPEPASPERPEPHRKPAPAR